MRAKITSVRLGGSGAYIALEIPKEQVNKMESMKGKDLDVTIKEYRQKRSVDANAMMWACLSEIANALHTDKWDVYLQMLKRYGKFTHICVKPAAVDAIKRQWRECEVVGDVNINGKPAVQMLCYYGSSTYDSKEFSTLLNGIVDEMAEMGLETPASEEMQAIFEQLEGKK